MREIKAYMEDRVATRLTPGEGGHFVEMKNLELNFIMTKSRLTIMGL